MCADKSVILNSVSVSDYYLIGMHDTEHDDNRQEAAEEESLTCELAFLFGKAIVEQARLIDVANLNMTDAMTAAIAEGIKKLKELRNNPAAQQEWVMQQPEGLKLVLCLWIMDMDLLGKIQVRSYLDG